MVLALRLYWSTDVDFTWLLALDPNSLEHSEIPFFLLTDIEVDSLSLLGMVFLFESTLDSFSKEYFLLELAVLRLFEVE